MVKTRHQKPTSSQPERSAEDHAPSKQPELEPSAPSHGYGTRRSTQLARPAQALGLHKRTQAEIHAEAERKRAEKEKKKQAAARKTERLEEGAKELARLEDERILADADEDRYLAQSLAELQTNDEEHEAPHQDDPLPQHHDTDSEAPMAIDIEDEQHDYHPDPMELDNDDGILSDGSEARARRHAVREGKKRATSIDLSLSPLLSDNRRPSIIHSDLSDSDSTSEDGLAEILRQLRNSASRTAKPGESSKQVDPDADQELDLPRRLRSRHVRSGSPPSGFSSDDDGLLVHAQERANKRLRIAGRDTDREDDHMDVDGVDRGSDGNATYAEDEEEDSQLVPDASERRKIKRTLVRGRIDAHRTQHSPYTTKVPKNASSQSSRVPTASSQQGRNANAFTTAFRTGRWQGPGIEPLPDPSPPRPRPKPKSVATPGPSSLLPRHPSNIRQSVRSQASQTPASSSQRQASSSRMPPSTNRVFRHERRMMEPDGSDIEHETFDDDMVASSREYAVAMGGSRRKSMVSARRLRDDEADVSVGRASQKKRKRRSRHPVPEDESRSATKVPDFIKPFLFSELVPTILEYFGAKTDPWNTCEHGPDELLNLAQELINDLCPRAEYRLSKSDVIYKVIQQEVDEWRSRFASAVVSAVDDAIRERFGPNPRRAEVQAWIRDATAAGGESLWARPHRNPDRAKGSLQSRFVLRSFATHLAATNGSIYLYGPPVGALSLAATAVQHIFPMYKTGRFIHGRAFSAANVGYLTESWYRKSVKRYARKQDKFAKLVRKASKFATSFYQTKARNGGETLQAPDIFDRSSPPLEDTDDDEVYHSGHDDDDDDDEEHHGNSRDFYYYSDD